MEKLKIKVSFLFVLVLTAMLPMVHAQNYKAPAIDAAGKITDQAGKHIGWVTSDGVIKDSSGVQIAHVDKNGNMVDHQTKKIMGKVEKNGTFVYHFEKGNPTTWTTSAPMSGTCEVKD